MIRVIVENLEFECIIGLLESERITPQRVVVDAKFQSEEFIDYAEVSRYLISSFREKKFLKVEDALEFFKDKFKRIYPNLSYFYMKIIKPDIISNARVGAELEVNY